MAELLDVLDAFMMPLKIGWVAWLAWGIGLVFWYRHEQSQTTSPRSAPVRRPFVSKPSMPQRAGTRLITPEPAIAHQAPVDAPLIAASPLAPPPVAPPVREPAPGLLDEPDNVADPVAELDKFVADFEMNTRHRRGGPPNGEASSFDDRAV
jgi:hypothetical protein